MMVKKRSICLVVLLLLVTVGADTQVASFCIAGACIATACSLKVVTSGNECLVERFGRYHHTLGPGWHFVWPVLEQISYIATKREQVLDVPPQQCYTRDNAPLKADAVVYMRIIDTKAARYNIMDLDNAILNLCLTQLREEVGKLTLDESFSSRERINDALLRELNSVSHTWGVEITRVEIQNLEPSKDILAAMELQMAAEREKRAAILHSEGEKIKLVNEAEGRAGAIIADAQARRQSIVLAAEAESERLKLEAEGIQRSIETITNAVVAAKDKDNGKKAGDSAADAAIQMLMLVRYMETQAKFAGGEGTKVLMFPSKDTVPLTYEGLQNLLK